VFVGSTGAGAEVMKRIAAPMVGGSATPVADTLNPWNCATRNTRPHRWMLRPARRSRRGAFRSARNGD
jgi:hypothetical protein